MKSCKEKDYAVVLEVPKCLKMPKKEIKKSISNAPNKLLIPIRIIAAGCPFCNTMLHDGVTNKGKESRVAVLDIAQLLAQTESL